MKKYNLAKKIFCKMLVFAFAVSSVAGISPLKVNAADEPVLDSVSISAARTLLFPGDVIDLTVTGKMSDNSNADLSNASKTFESTNPAVLEVDSAGRVTAISNGYASVNVDVTLGTVTKTGTLALRVAKTLDLQEDDNFGAESNPTGNPIGGGEGYNRLIDPLDAQYYVGTAAELAQAVNSSVSGDVIYVNDNADIDMTVLTLPLVLKEGVTLASGRGKVLENGQISKGAMLRADKAGIILFKTSGPNARFTGLRIYGGDENIGITYSGLTKGITTTYYTEIDNNEIFGWSYTAVQLSDGHVHHNYIHHNMRTGYGYGIMADVSQVMEGVLIEANIFDWNRFAATATGKPGIIYEARYNLMLENITCPAPFGMSGDNGGESGNAGDIVNVHHNTFAVLKNYVSGDAYGCLVRGIPIKGYYIHNNWFYNPDPTKSARAYYLKPNDVLNNCYVGKNKFGTGNNISYHTGVSANQTDLKLSADQYDLGVGGTAALTPTSSFTIPDTITYTSDNPAVAAASKSGTKNGTVTAVGPGVCNITASMTVNNIVRTSTIQITVNRDTASAPYLDTVTLTGGTVEEGGSLNLTLSGRMNDGTNADLSGATVVYRSGNKYVAEVDGSGVVTGKEAGTAVIWADVTLNGVLRTASVQVIVYGDIASAVLTNTKQSLVAGQTLQIGVKAILTNGRTLPTATGVTITYTSSDTNVATVSDAGLITAKAAGSVTITGTIFNGTSAQAQMNLTINPAPVLDSISISAAKTLLFPGDVIDLTVSGKMSDNSNADLSNAIKTFESTNPAVLEADSNIGRVTAQSNGYASVNVSVTLGTITKTGTLALRVAKTLDLQEDDNFGAESNPTGNPIGGGEGYNRLIDPSSAQYYVSTAAELALAVDSSVSGDVIYVDDNADIDMTVLTLPLALKEGVTLASGRGRTLENGQISKGAMLRADKPGIKLFKTSGPNARFTGLRIYGGDENFGNSYAGLTQGIVATYYTEVDNNEIFGWSYTAVELPDGYVHHNYIHHNMRMGYGYGILVDPSQMMEGVLAEANIFDWNRHGITCSGKPTSIYEARYNLQLGNLTSSGALDMHGDDGGDRGNAGDIANIHHNTFAVLKNYSTTGDPCGCLVRGKPIQGFYVHNNWFYDPDPTKGTRGLYLVPNDVINNCYVGKNKFGTGNNISYHTGVSERQTDLELSTEKYDLGIGGTAILTPTSSFTIPDTITYTTDNPAVATVSKSGAIEGTVTAVGPGVCNITASMTVNNKVRPATVQITVNRDSASATYLDTVTLSGGSVKEGESLELTLNAQMNDGTNADLSGATVVYRSDNKYIAEVDGSGVVTGKEAGTAEIWADVTLNGVLRTTSVPVIVYGEIASVEFTNIKQSLVVGETLQTGIKAILTNGRTLSTMAGVSITYASSDTIIADVSDSGIITTKAAGNVTITATVFNGSTAEAQMDLKIKPLPGDVIINDDFEDYPVGQFPSDYWMDSNRSVGENMSVEEDSSTSNKYLLMEKNGDSSVGFENSFPSVTSGALVFETDVAVGQTDAHIQTAQFLSDTGVALVRIYFHHQTGQITVHDGSNKISLMPYEANRNYKIRAVINMDTRIYDVYIDGVLKATGIKFNNATASNISRIWFFMGAKLGPTATVKIDDVLLYKLVPAEISLDQDGGTVNMPVYTISGKVNLPADVTVNNEPVTFGEGFSFSKQVSLSEGNNTIEVSAVNIMGNKTSKSINVILDTTPPATSLNIDGSGENGWYNSDVTVTLSSEDSLSGVSQTVYKINGDQDWSVYSGAVTITVEGTNTIYYRSTDKAGNVEDVRESTVRIDKTAPSFTLNVNGDVLDEGGSFDNILPLTFRVWDDLSGVYSAGITIGGINYNVDVTTQSSIEIDLSDKVGSQTAIIRAQDTAGNILEKTFRFTLATTIDSMLQLIERYKESGDLKEPMGKILKNVLNIQQKMLDKRRPDITAKLMEHSLKLLDNKGFNKLGLISEKAGGVLRADGEWLINEWNNQPVTGPALPDSESVESIIEGLDIN